MTENISLKIVKLKEKSVENSKNYALYEIEPYQYGDSNCSLMKIDYRQESDLNIFEEGKKYNIKLGKDKIFVDQVKNTLIIDNADWDAQET
jgi:hypothetical protein